ncbi:MAG TPA: SCO family protein [Chthoniobacter sp.]|jgi:protein SCO1/2
MKLFLFVAFCTVSSLALAGQLSDDTLRQIRFDQKIGAQIPLGAVFRDETGRSVHLANYFGKKPVVLVLGYYGCPMLCTLVSNGLIESFHDLKSNIGDQFDVLHVSVSPTEKPALAAAKKREYLRHYGRPGAEKGWHFLTGDEPAIHELADAVGFRYAYDPVAKQYAHPSGFIVLTPQGQVSRYFFGVDFRAEDLSNALHTASKNETGSVIRQLFLLCFHYRPITNKYGTLVLDGIRTIGVATLLALIIYVTRSFRGERKLRS